MAYCGGCPYTDGMVYTSLPPKVKCTITGEFHYYEDSCNCEDIKGTIIEEQEHIKKLLSEPIVKLADLSVDSAIVIDDTISTERANKVNTGSEAYEDVVVGSTNCIICGESVMLHFGESGPKVCDSCKKAVKFIKEHFRYDEM